MQDLRQEIIGLLIENATKLGIESDEKGYVNSLEDNLVEKLTSWNQIKNDLAIGDGKELSCNGANKPKFCALHSSAALCVNSFMPFVEYPNQLSFLEEINYTEKVFGKKLDTGVGTLTIDLLLSNKAYSVGVISKFLETLSLKKTKSLATFIKQKKLIEGIPDSFFNLIQRYLDTKYEGYLDVSQLIKHTLGLIKYAKSNHTRPKLVYMYWTPDDTGSLPASFIKHQKELEAFSGEIRPFIDFIPMRYEDLWSEIEKMENCHEYISKLRNKCQITLSPEEV